MEYFDLYDEQGQRLGRSKERALVHRDGDWHRSIHLWVVRSDGTLVFQQRSAGKDTWPNHFTCTVGGHYAAGEDLAQVLREAREEVGQPVGPGDLLPLGTWRYDDASEAGIRDREWQDVFLWPSTLPLTAFKPDPEEVAALAEVSPEALLRLLAGEAGEAPMRFRARGTLLVEPRSLHRDDLVPTPAYHTCIARAALAYAGGGAPPSLEHLRG